MTLDLSDVSDDELRAELAHRTGAACYYCGETATFWCDALVRKDIINAYGGWDVCSRPVCANHRIKVGVIFDHDGPGSMDTIDYCQECKDRENARHAPKPGPHGGKRAGGRMAA